MRENERIHRVLESRDKENENLKLVVKSFGERDSAPLSDRSISTIARASAVKSPKLNIKNPGTFVV